MILIVVLSLIFFSGCKKDESARNIMLSTAITGTVVAFFNRDFFLWDYIGRPENLINQIKCLFGYRFTVPNFVGYSRPDVERLANKANVSVEKKGTALLASRQSIEPDKLVDEGTMITVWFEKDKNLLPNGVDIPNFRRIANKKQAQYSGIEVDDKVVWWGSTNTLGYGYTWSVDSDNNFAEKYIELVEKIAQFKRIDYYSLDYMKYSNVMEYGWLFEYTGDKKKVPTFEVNNSETPKEPYKAHLFIRKVENYKNGKVTLSITFVEKRLIYEEDK